jgi:rubredoxin
MNNKDMEVVHILESDEHELSCPNCGVVYPITEKEFHKFNRVSSKKKGIKCNSCDYIFNNIDIRTYLKTIEK